MKNISSVWLLAMLSACDPRTDNKPQNSMVNSGVFSCSMSGESVLRDSRGEEVSQIKTVEYFKLSLNGSKLLQFDKKIQDFRSACPPDRQCKFHVTPAAIAVEHQLVDGVGMSMVGRVDIDRIAATIRSVNKVQWLTSNRSANESLTGECQPSQAPQPRL